MENLSYPRGFWLTSVDLCWGLPAWITSQYQDLSFLLCCDTRWRSLKRINILTKVPHYHDSFASQLCFHGFCSPETNHQIKLIMDHQCLLPPSPSLFIDMSTWGMLSPCLTYNRLGFHALWLSKMDPIVLLTV